VVDARVAAGVDVARAQAVQMPLEASRVWATLQTRG
jgi:hypothetical protein